MTAYRTRQHRRQAIAPKAAEQDSSMVACSAPNAHVLARHLPHTLQQESDADV